MKDIIREILPGIVEFRHALHRIPEMAGEEFETSRLIRERLASLGISAENLKIELKKADSRQPQVRQTVRLERTDENSGNEIGFEKTAAIQMFQNFFDKSYPGSKTVYFESKNGELVNAKKLN